MNGSKFYFNKIDNQHVKIRYSDSRKVIEIKKIKQRRKGEIRKSRENRPTNLIRGCRV